MRSGVLFAAGAVLAGSMLASCVLDRAGLSLGEGGMGGATTTSTQTTGGAPPGECEAPGACADPACAAFYECVPAVPDGWDGPFRVSSAPFGSEPLGCELGGSPDVYFAGPGGPAACGDCSCDASAASCSLPTARYFSDEDNCTGSSSLISPNGMCQPFGDTCNSCDRARSMQIEAPSTAQGSCSASGGELGRVPPMWESEFHVCTTPDDAGGCAEAEAICLRKGEATACVARAGAHGCPSDYPELHGAFSGGDDTRDCSACQCGEPSCTAGTFTLYDTGNCSGGTPPPLTVGPSCSGDVRPWVDGSAASYQAVAGTVQGCAPSGGAPTGAVTGQGEMTICCVGRVGGS